MRKSAEAIFAEFWEMSRMDKFAHASGFVAAAWGGVLHRRAIVSARFGSVGLRPVCINAPDFCRLVYSRDRGNKNAAVFTEISTDGYFD